MNKNIDPTTHSPLQNSRLVNLIFQVPNKSYPKDTAYDQYLFTDSIIFHPKIFCSTPKPQKKIEIIRSKQYSKCLNSSPNTSKFLMHRSKIKTSKVESRKSHLLFGAKQQKKTELCINKMNTSAYSMGINERNNRFSDKLLSLRQAPKKINRSLLQQLTSVIRKFNVNRPFHESRSQSCQTKRNPNHRRRRESEIKPWEYKKQEDF